MPNLHRRGKPPQLPAVSPPAPLHEGRLREVELGGYGLHGGRRVGPMLEHLRSGVLLEG